MTAPPPRPSRLSQSPALREWLICLGLCLVTLAAFLPVRHFGFISLDDDGENGYVKDNLHVQAGFTWESIRWAFTAFHSFNWHPVTWLSHMLDCRLFGLNPAGHHLVNLLFHIANTLLLYGFLRQASKAVWPSAMVAALFALHPLHIQSVAWISERKDVLSAFFFLLTLMAYVAYVRALEGKTSFAKAMKDKPFNLQPSTSSGQGGGRRAEVRSPWSVIRSPSSICYLLSLFSFALGLMSKPMLVTLPAILLLLDFWPLGRITHHASRITLFRRLLLEKVPFLALAAATCVVTMQAQADSVAPIEYLTLDWRVANVLVSYVMYLIQTLWPVHLAIFYPLVKLTFWKAAGSGLLLLLLTAWLVQRRKTAPELLLGWLWYLVMLLPVIGLVQAGTQARADRYTYLPLIGFFIFAVWGFARLAAGWSRARVLCGLAAVLVLTATFAFTRWQLGFWRDSVTLFTRVVELSGPNPESKMFLGDALVSQGDYAAAADNYRFVLGFAPGVGHLHYRLGGAFKALGKWPEAAAEFATAVRLDPADPKAGKLLGDMLCAEGKWAEAGEAYTNALRYHPGDRTIAAAIETHKHLVSMYEQLQTHPTAAAHLNAAAVSEWQHNFSAALEHYAAAWRLQPENPQLLNNYAWLLATCPDKRLRDVPRALELARHACELTNYENTAHEKAEYLSTLAAAQAGTGNFADAIATAQRACQFAATNGEPAFLKANQDLLARYRAHQAAVD